MLVRLSVFGFMVGMTSLLNGQNAVGKDSLSKAYVKLQKELARYQQFAESNDWPKIPAKKDSLDLRKSSRFVKLLRSRLEKEGYLRKPLFFKTDSFDLDFVNGLKEFQRYHGIAETGYPGPLTVAAMNVSAQERVRQIEINLVRWKNFHPPSEYILVNIPDFRMDFYQDNKVRLSMRTVVGKKNRQTPVFYSRLTYLVLNPTWNIPPNVLRKDVLEKVKKNPDYLKKNNMKVYTLDSSGQRRQVDDLAINWKEISSKHVPYEIIQEAGADNALGQVKFMFPNTFSVYMHDSPAKNLFAASEPLYSAGCVRLADAKALAELLLKREGWTDGRLTDVLASGITETVVLRHSLMVYLQYFTAWVDEDGHIQFRRDFYSLDKSGASSTTAAPVTTK